MNLSNLIKINPSKGRRVGRGTGSGHGKTSGRGTKGQKSRTGKKLRPGFEGGQMPLVLRVPKKRGFKSIKKTETVSILTLEKIAPKIKGQKITKKDLKSLKVIKNPKNEVKLVGKKDLKLAKEVQVDKMSSGARKSLKR
ncbi:MAG: 50S ribosomal protein L15 [Patescibacteria group bacterium]|nr:50S ribosomal protein L15 [Patescibacteria group bacterium]MCL5093805.1 50S ribosomal protein L15 [Patescibacteria group bacterium]